MDRDSKNGAYQKLIDQVRESYQTEPGSLKWYEGCREINLWTSWQGRGSLDAQIMPVGQDWGCPWDKDAAKEAGNIRRMNAGEQVPYMRGNDNPADQNIALLFQEIGYEMISHDDKNKELFFPNFVLGYRAKGISDGFQKNWAKHDAPFFKSLVEIIQPESILCLRRDTFGSLLMAFEQSLPAPMHSYNRFIESNRNPVTVLLPTQQPMRVFAPAHCGKPGTTNRNRGRQGKHSLQCQIDDWRKIIQTRSKRDLVQIFLRQVSLLSPIFALPQEKQWFFFCVPTGQAQCFRRPDATRECLCPPQKHLRAAVTGSSQSAASGAAFPEVPARSPRPPLPLSPAESCSPYLLSGMQTAAIKPYGIVSAS